MCPSGVLIQTSATAQKRMLSGPTQGGARYMAWQLFYSYSHKDIDLRDRLGTYLAPLKQQQKISEWHDRKIEPGANWETEISSHLESAHLILLLVSADFLASEYCFGVEMDKAMSRLKRGSVKVVPVLLKPC